MNTEKITTETEVSTTELACVLGITGRRVQQMAQDGTITTVERGRFNLSESVQQYIKFITKEPVSEDELKMEKAKRQAEVTLRPPRPRSPKLRQTNSGAKCTAPRMWPQ